MKKNQSLGERMKEYERAFQYKLPRRMPLLIRIDGKAFHSFCRGLNKPFDNDLMSAMNRTAIALCDTIENCVFAYVQSDEINLLLHNYKKLNTSAWFDNKKSKIESVSASMCSVYFNNIFRSIFDMQKREVRKIAFFDSRAWVLPESEVVNYFIQRQNDWTRNSLSMLARNYYSQKELNGKRKQELHDMIHEKGDNWADLSTDLKNGRAVKRFDGVWKADLQTPIFTKDRNYIQELLEVEEE